MVKASSRPRRRPPKGWPTAAFWRPYLAPLRGIGPPQAAADLDPPAIAARFWTDGFASLPGAMPAHQIAPLAAAVRRLAAAGLPPVFLFLAPETWRAFAPVEALLTYMLGRKPALLPHFWAWHVPPRAGARGWPPHRDYQGPSVIGPPGQEQAASLSLWLALDAVGPDQAALRLLPIGAPAAAAVPLTGPAGTIGLWRQDLWHWSDPMRATARRPRISLSLEFQNRAHPPLATPLLDPAAPPAWPLRRDLVAAQLAAYGGMETLALGWRHIAARRRRRAG